MNRFVLALVATVVAGFTTAAQATTQVSLLHANSIVMTNGTISFQEPTFDVLVQNLSPTKQVYIHIETPEGTWVDAPLSYNRPADNGYEVWSGVYLDKNSAGVPSYAVWNPVFDVKYVVNGNTYWDNNNGANYSLDSNSGDVLYDGLNVWNESFLPSIITPDSVLNGSVTVSNLAYVKNITVVYSIDNWATTKTAVATFSGSFWQASESTAANPNQYGYENWSYVLDIGENATQVQYAISYTVNGQTYWDNNFGQNYTTTIQYGR